jgi:hypothetical protein
MKNKLLGFLDGIQLLILISIMINEGNNGNYTSVIGWFTATIYFLITAMHRFDNRK